MAGEGAVMEKALTAVERKLTREEYLEFLRLITPRLGDATRELRAVRKRLSEAKIRAALKRGQVSG